MDADNVQAHLQKKAVEKTEKKVDGKFSNVGVIFAVEDESLIERSEKKFEGFKTLREVYLDSKLPLYMDYELMAFLQR